LLRQSPLVCVHCFLFPSVKKMPHLDAGVVNPARNGDSDHISTDMNGNGSGKGILIPPPEMQSFVERLVERVGPPKTAFGSPGPLGFFAFTIDTFIGNLINSSLYSSDYNPVLGPVGFVCGMTQFIAGMWELRLGNTFGGTGFGLYGTWWMLFGLLMMVSFPEQIAMAKSLGLSGPDAVAYANANVTEMVALVFIVFTIISFTLWIAAARMSWSVMIVLFFVMMTYLMGAIGLLLPNANCVKASGAFGIGIAITSWWVGIGALWNMTYNAQLLPLGVTGPITTWPHRYGSEEHIKTNKMHAQPTDHLSPKLPAMTLSGGDV